MSDTGKPDDTPATMPIRRRLIIERLMLKAAGICIDNLDGTMTMDAKFFKDYTRLVVRECQEFCDGNAVRMIGDHFKGLEE